MSFFLKKRVVTVPMCGPGGHLPNIITSSATPESTLHSITKSPGCVDRGGGGSSRGRSDNLTVKSRLLYQLSYGPGQSLLQSTIWSYQFTPLFVTSFSV